MKSMKKLMLVVFVLLASVMVLAGCKNDSVPEIPKYTVKFVTDHGTAPKDLVVESGTKLAEEQLQIEAEVGDNIFEYWYEKDDLTQKVESGYPVTENVTLVAKWRDRGTTSVVTFDPPNGTKFFSDETVTVALSSTTEGATIQYKLDDGEWRDYSEEITVTSDTTITAYATKKGLKPSAESSATYTVRKLTSITSPTRTVYSVGDTFDSTGMEVTAEYDDGETRTVEGTISSDTSTLTNAKGINKDVTVSYTEGEKTVTATFTVDVANYKFTETVQDVESSYTGTASSTSTPQVTAPIYKKFGDWPQTIKGTGVTVGSGTLVRGGFTYYVGSDGNYYVKTEEKAYESGVAYKYSDGTQAGQGGTGEKWFKVEPIVWRVLTDNYSVPRENGELQSTGNALLLAEKILTGGIPYYSGYDVQRRIGGVKIFPNNYGNSQIRAFLNGLSYEYKESYSTKQIEKDEYKDAGFLQTAFTESARNLIAETTVNNSKETTNPDGKATLWNNGDNPYASETNTEDKIFLLSEQEATTEEYGFAEYIAYGKGSTRIRVTTDYAKATGAYQEGTAGYGGWWWLRSPYCDDERYAHYIIQDGSAYLYDSVRYSDGGVVPALCIQLQ